MRVPLASAASKVGFAALVLALALPYGALALRHYQALSLVRSGDAPSLRQSLALESGNSTAWTELGEHDLMAGDTAAAIADLESALRFDPRASTAWLLLATAYQVTGDAPRQHDAVRSALRVDGSNPRVAWTAANLFLAEGNNDDALRQFRTVLEADVNSYQTLYLCWRALHDADRILGTLVPARTAPHLLLLDLLVEQGDVPAATKAWDHLIALRQPFPAERAFAFMDLLLKRGEADRAWRAWTQLAEVDASLRPYVPAGGNVVVNGGFDEDLLGGGFDWRIEPAGGVHMATDTAEFHGGRAALSLTFEDASAAHVGLSQVVRLEPDADYELSVWGKSEDLLSAAGPRLAVSDYKSGTQLAASDEFSGTGAWRQMTVIFHAPPQTSLAVLSLERAKPGTLVRGHLWLDDVVLKRK